MIENKEKITELILQMTEIVARINLETSLSCWLDISGHVHSLKIRVGGDKDDMFTKRITQHEMYYYRDYMKDGGFSEFISAAHIAITDLNNILSSKWDRKYTAYCNLIDMSCSQVFTSEDAAQLWVNKMKRKYNKVGAIVGYNTELIKESL